MAELENTTIKQEPIYLNYGQNQIDQQAFLDSAASGLEEYVSRQGWSQKRKDLFRKAYQDIMSRGVTGATNTSGVWEVTHNGAQIDLDSLSKKEREMYGEAAYYIQQQMNGISPKEAEPVKKEDLPLFDNKYFTQQFLNHVSNNMFGGRDFSASEDWDILDERGENGLRGVTKRANKLAELLQSYSDSLEEGKYNFENSPFKDLNDLKSRIGNAISALKTEDLSDDVPALNAIGINPKDWFYNGANDSSGKTDANGNPLTYEQLALLEQQQAEQESQALAAKQEAEAKANRGVLLSLGGIHGTDARTRPQEYVEHLAKNHGTGQEAFNSINSLVQQLLDEANTTRSLNPDKKRQLGNLLYYIREKNPNYQGLGNGERTNLSDQDWKELQTHKNLASQNKNDYIRLPWQTSDGKYTYADNQGNIYFMKPSNKQKLEGPKFTRSQAYNNYKNNFLKQQNEKSLEHTWGEGLTDDMKADLTAMGLDAVSAGAAFAPGYGTAISAATGIGATLTGAYADRKRGESWGSTLSTAGFGLTMDILGLIPGVGVGAKAGKIAKTVAKGAKWIGPALGGLAGLAYGPGAISAFNKFTSGNKDKITAEELRDFTYAMRAIALGGIRKAGATYQGNRTLAKAKAEGRVVENSTKEAATITTKNGEKVKLSDKDFEALKGNGTRESKIEILKKNGLNENDIDWKGMNPLRGRFKTSSKSSRISGLTESSQSSGLKWNTTSSDYKGIQKVSNENLLRRFTTMSTPTSGIIGKIRDRWKGNDILGTTKPSPQREAIKEEIKALPRISYAKPKIKTTQAIPESRRLPAPGQINRGNIVDNTRTGSLSSNRQFSIKQNRQELNNAWDSYGVNPKRPSSIIKGGYNSGNTKISGTFSQNVTVNGKQIPVTYKASGENIEITIGKDTKTFSSFQNARQYMAKQLFNLSKKTDHSKIANTLRYFKQHGVLKQGGTIEKSLDETIIEFLNKQK